VQPARGELRASFAASRAAHALCGAGKWAPGREQRHSMPAQAEMPLVPSAAQRLA